MMLEIVAIYVFSGLVSIAIVDRVVAKTVGK